MMKLIQPVNYLVEICVVELEIYVLLEQERRQFRMLGRRQVIEVQLINIEIGPHELTFEIDDAVPRPRRMRYHMDPVRKHKAQMAPPEGANRSTDDLPGCSFESNLNLKVPVAMRRDELISGALEPDVEVRMIGSLMHPIRSNSVLAAHAVVEAADREGYTADASLARSQFGYLSPRNP